MAPEVIACDENPDSTYDCKVSCVNIECAFSIGIEILFFTRFRMVADLQQY